MTTIQKGALYNATPSELHDFAYYTASTLTTSLDEFSNDFGNPPKLDSRRPDRDLWLTLDERLTKTDGKGKRDLQGTRYILCRIEKTMRYAVLETLDQIQPLEALVYAARCWFIFDEALQKNNWEKEKANVIEKIDVQTLGVIREAAQVVKRFKLKKILDVFYKACLPSSEVSETQLRYEVPADLYLACVDFL